MFKFVHKFSFLQKTKPVENTNINIYKIYKYHFLFPLSTGSTTSIGKTSPGSYKYQTC